MTKADGAGRSTSDGRGMAAARLRGRPQGLARRRGFDASDEKWKQCMEWNKLDSDLGVKSDNLIEKFSSRP